MTAPTDAQVTAACLVWLGTTDPDTIPEHTRTAMARTIAAALTPHALEGDHA